MEPKNIFIALIIFIIAIIGYLIIDFDNSDDAALLNDPSIILDEANETMSDTTTEQTDPPIMEIEAGEMDKGDDAMMNKENDMEDNMPHAAAGGSYVPYDSGLVMHSDGDHKLLFFHATWCPSCRTLDKDISASAGDIPNSVEIYKVDYDTNIDLRKKYGVTTQHTIVEVDSEGNLIQKWSGGSTLESILAKL